MVLISRGLLPVTHRRTAIPLFTNPNVTAHGVNRNEPQIHVNTPPCMILGIILKVDERRTLSNGPEKKLMTMHKDLHPRDDKDILYVSRKEGGRGLNSIEDSVDTSIRPFEDYIKTQERLIMAPGNNTNNTKINRTAITKKQKWKEKQLYGYFKRQTSEISHGKTWTMINLKIETESLIIAAKSNAIRTNYGKAKIDKTKQNNKSKREN